jgi:hypothetical protein
MWHVCMVASYASIHIHVVRVYDRLAPHVSVRTTKFRSPLTEMLEKLDFFLASKTLSLLFL